MNISSALSVSSKIDASMPAVHSLFFLCYIYKKAPATVKDDNAQESRFQVVVAAENDVEVPAAYLAPGEHSHTVLEIQWVVGISSSKKEV